MYTTVCMHKPTSACKHTCTHTPAHAMGRNQIGKPVLWPEMVYINEGDSCLYFVKSIDVFKEKVRGFSKFQMTV